MIFCKGKCQKLLDPIYFEFRKDTQKYRTKCRKCDKGYKTALIDKQDKIRDLFLKGLKECSKCLKIKSLDDFNNDKYTVTGKTSYCRTCTKERHKKTSKKRVLRSKATRYNITIEEVKKIEKKKCCEICKEPFSDVVKPHIDHCHNTGIIRGRLCSYCNLGLGHFKDNVKILKNAIKYLNNNNNNNNNK